MLRAVGRAVEVKWRLLKPASKALPSIRSLASTQHLRLFSVLEGPAKTKSTQHMDGKERLQQIQTKQHLQAGDIVTFANTLLRLSPARSKRGLTTPEFEEAVSWLVKQIAAFPLAGLSPSACRLAWCLDRMGRPAVSADLLRRTSDNIDHLNAIDVTNAIELAIKLKINDLLLPLYGRAASLVSVDSVGMISICSRLAGRSGYQAAVGFMDTVAAFMAEQGSPQLLARMKGQELSQIAYGLASYSAKLKNGGAVQKAVAALAEELGRRCRAALAQPTHLDARVSMCDVALGLWATSTLQIPSNGLLIHGTRWFHRNLSNTRAWNTQDLAQAVWAMGVHAQAAWARLRDPRQQRHSAPSAAAKAAAADNTAVLVAASELLHAATRVPKHQLSRMNQHAASLLAMGVARLHQAANRLGTTSALITRYAQRRYLSPRHAVHEFLTRIAQLSAANLDTFTAHSLRSILWSLASARVDFPEFYLNAAPILRRKAKELDAQSLANIMWSYARQNCIADPLFVQLVAQVHPTALAGGAEGASGSEAQLLHMNAEEIAQVLWSCARLSCSYLPATFFDDVIRRGTAVMFDSAKHLLPPEQQQSWESELAESPAPAAALPPPAAESSADVAHRLTLFAWSIVALDLAETDSGRRFLSLFRDFTPALTPIYTGLSQRVDAQADGEAKASPEGRDEDSGVYFDNRMGLTQIYFIHTLLSLGPHPSLGVYPQELLECAREQRLKAGRSVSPFQKVVSSVLHALGGVYSEHQLEYECPTTALSIDIAWPEYQVALEIDGPSHFRPGFSLEEGMATGVALEDIERSNAAMAFLLRTGKERGSGSMTGKAAPPTHNASQPPSLPRPQSIAERTTLFDAPLQPQPRGKVQPKGRSGLSLEEAMVESEAALAQRELRGKGVVEAVPVEGGWVWADAPDGPVMEKVPLFKRGLPQSLEVLGDGSFFSPTGGRTDVALRMDTVMKRQLLQRLGWRVVSIPYFLWSELATARIDVDDFGNPVMEDEAAATASPSGQIITELEYLRGLLRHELEDKPRVEANREALGR